MWALADAVDDQFRSMVLMAGFMGMRRGELFGLRRGHVDLMHDRVVIAEQCQQLDSGAVVFGEPKTNAGRRTIAIPAPVVSELAIHLERFVSADADSLVFAGVKGGPLRNGVWHKKWAEARATVGLDALHFHDLRHVANTLTAASGASTKELMHRMGHAS
ncbi:MAG TPA: site-specific integrase [Acidimicrobiales bacterium]|nr:site-specific integrase [Acidimicrobiales bacterium]